MKKDYIRLDWYVAKENKMATILMTREEAIRKIETTANKGYDAIPTKNFLAALEALGLIQFKEEKNPFIDNFTFVLKDVDDKVHCYTGKEIRLQIEKLGLKIVKTTV